MTGILRVSVFLLVVSLFHFRSTVQMLDNGTHSLHLLVLLPYPSSEGNPSWSGALNVLPAIRLAVQDVQSSDLLIGYNLSLMERDCGCNYTNRARVSFLDSLFYNEEQIVGLIGPGCSASAVAIAPLIVQQNASLLSIHGAGTPQLENHTKYPNSFGIFGSSLGVVNTIIALMNDRDWTNVGVLYDSSRVFHSSTHDALVERVNNSQVRIYSGALSDYQYHLQQIREKSLRIVFLLAGPALTRNLLCTAFHRNLTYPSIQWVVVERQLIELKQDVIVYYQNKPYNCSEKMMADQVLNGSLFIIYRLKNLDENAATYANISYNDFECRYEQEIEKMNRANTNASTYSNHFKVSPWGSMYYDAVWAMAIALNNVSQQSHGFNLKEYGTTKDTGRVSDTLELRKIMHTLNFVGVSGKVKFNISTGFTERTFDVLVVYNCSTMKRIAFYDHGSSIRHLENNSGYYLDDEFPEILKKTRVEAVIVIGVFTSIIFFATVFFHIFGVRYKNDYFVRAASVKLSQMAYFGCYLLMLTSITYVIVQASDLHHTIRAIFCHSTYVFCSIGFTLLFGTIWAKEWRLYRISNHSWKPGKCLSDRPLFVIILLATSGDIFINIVWISYDRFEVKSNQISFDGTNAIIAKHCHANFLLGWYLAIYVYNLLILLFACILAAITHKIYIVGVQTKAVKRITYFTVLLMGLGIPIQIIFVSGAHSEQTLIFLVDSLILNIAVVLAIVFLFFPPLRPRFYKICKQLPARIAPSTSIILTKH